MPIHPEYAEAILRGQKRVEFRKVRLRTSVEDVLIYATAPVSKLVGYFSVDAIEAAAPPLLWQRYGRLGQITKSEFERYYAGSKTGFAIRLSRCRRFAKPLPLTVLSARLRPPQSYHYLSVNPRALDRVA